jgi:cytoskeletal protein CcmA (bactofilin family)
MIGRATLNAERTATAHTAPPAESEHFGPYDAVDISAEGISVYVKGNFDDSGAYMEPSIISSGHGIQVIGDLTLSGPADIAGDLCISGNLRIKNKLTSSGKVSVRGTVYAAGNAVIACPSVSADNVKITGTVTVTGEMAVLGKLEVKKGGKLIIEKTGTVTMPRGNDTRSARLVVADGASVEVHGRLDVLWLTSLQILNSGGIWSERFNGTVSIFYDVYTFVNGTDRSDGDLAQHGRGVSIQICQNGIISSVAVKMNGVELDASLYTFDAGSVTISASAMDGATGDIDIYVISDGDTMPVPEYIE